MTYTDPILSRYVDLIKANTGDIKSFYFGEPLRFPSVDLPCLFISKRTTNIDPITNAEDQHNMLITLTLVTDVRSDLSSESANFTAGISTLYDIMEGRNEDYTLKDTSIVDILRSNLEPGTNIITDLETITRVDYSKTLANRTPQEWWIMATVDFACKFIQVR